MQNLDLGVQKQLLQVLDRGTYSPVGSDRVMTVGCRVILAMTDDPDELMRRGHMLKDLRYRFGACAIWVPPLAERRAEIPALARQFLDDCPRQTGVVGPSRLDAGALAVLEEGEYPGNVRQLSGVIVRGYLMGGYVGREEILVEDLPEGLCPPLKYVRRGDPAANRRAVERALRRTGGNVNAAARALGVSRNTIKGTLPVAERARCGRAREGKSG